MFTFVRVDIFSLCSDVYILLEKIDHSNLVKDILILSLFKKKIKREKFRREFTDPEIIEEQKKIHKRPSSSLDRLRDAVQLRISLKRRKICAIVT